MIGLYALLQSDTAQSFMLKSSPVSSFQASCHRMISRELAQFTLFSVMDPLIVEDSADGVFDDKDKDLTPALDVNGKRVAVGMVVRMCKDGLRAFHVAKTAKGNFNDAKDFIADETMNYLELPVGLRGVVTKVYEHEHEVSANFPIQVKFEASQYIEEGYDSPGKFLMHLDSAEVEIVDA